MLATRVASYFIAAVAVAAAAAAELCFNLTGREALPTFRLAGSGDGATDDAAAALKFQQFDRRLRRMMIALIMSLGSGFVGGGFATHVECLVQRDRRRSAPGYKLDAAALPTAPTATATESGADCGCETAATASASAVILVLLMRKSFRFVGAAIKTSVKSKYCGKLRKVFLLLKADLALRVAWENALCRKFHSLGLLLLLCRVKPQFTLPTHNYFISI